MKSSVSKLPAEVFDRTYKVASQELWTKPEELTEAQKLVPVVARWRVTQKLENGNLQAVNENSGVLGEFTGKVVEKQGMGIDDVIEVREGKTRDQDVVVRYPASS